MKRLFAVMMVCALTLSLVLTAGCSSSTNGSSNESATQDGQAAGTLENAQTSAITPGGVKPVVRVGALRGPTGLGMCRLMERNEQNETSNIYNFDIVGAPDEISGKIISGELDIACVPTNLAAVLYARTEGRVSVISVSTLGVLSILQKNDEQAVTGIADLSGKTIYSTGQGATQEYVLNYLLAQNGVTDAEVVYRSEHAELAAMMLEGRVEYAMLPQPFVTTVTNQDDAVKVALDITDEWNRASGGAQLAMGAVIVRNDFLEKNRAAVDNFLLEYGESVDFVNENVDEGAALAGQFDIINEGVAKAAIPKCNIVCITGEEMKTAVSAFLDVLYAANPQSVGGALPEDGFYYLP